MPDHLRLNLDLIELLPGVNPNDTANHLRHNDHITQMRLHQVWLLIWLCLLLGLAEFLDEAHRTAFETAVEATAGARVHDIAELFGGEVEEVVEVDAAVGEFAEGALLLELYPGDDMSVLCEFLASSLRVLVQRHSRTCLARAPGGCGTVGWRGRRRQHVVWRVRRARRSARRVAESRVCCAACGSVCRGGLHAQGRQAQSEPVGLVEHAGPYVCDRSAGARMEGAGSSDENSDASAPTSGTASDGVAGVP